MTDVIRHGNEGIDSPDGPDNGGAERREAETLLDKTCSAPGCELRYRDHSREQAAECLDRIFASEWEASFVPGIEREAER
jgi:hypothetical protein